MNHKNIQMAHHMLHFCNNKISIPLLVYFLRIDLKRWSEVYFNRKVIDQNMEGIDLIDQNLSDNILTVLSHL